MDGFTLYTLYYVPFFKSNLPSSLQIISNEITSYLLCFDLLCLQWCYIHKQRRNDWYCSDLGSTHTLESGLLPNSYGCKVYRVIGPFYLEI